MNQKPLLINSEGVNTGVAFCFLRSIKNVVDQFNADNVIVTWDKKLNPETPNFRKSLTADYKGNRNEELNKEVYSNIDEIYKALELLGIKNIFPGSLEADDVISWLTKTETGKKIIVSVDNDFIQLIAPEILLFKPGKNILIGPDNVVEHCGLTPEEHLYFKAIKGDESDNIPGIDGFGKVKGTALAKAYGDFKKNIPVSEKHHALILTHKDFIEEKMKIYDLSYGISVHPEEVAIYTEQYDRQKSLKPKWNEFIQYCTDLEYNSIVNNIQDWKRLFNKNQNTAILEEFFKKFS